MEEITIKTEMKLRAVKLHSKTKALGFKKFPLDLFWEYVGKDKYSRDNVNNFLAGKSAKKDLLDKLENFYINLKTT